MKLGDKTAELRPQIEAVLRRYKSQFEVRAVSEADAAQYIFGYTCSNDVTAAEIQAVLKNVAGGTDQQIKVVGMAQYNVGVGVLHRNATTSGGPYSTIGSPTATGYTDTTAVNGTTYYYVVSAVNSSGESANSSEAAVSLGGFSLAVNSGGAAAGQFVADTYFSGGAQAGAVSTTIDTSGVVNPAPQAVYQTERFGNFSYTITGLSAGQSYKVRLHFAETYWTAVGQRKFNVSINGAQVLLPRWDLIRPLVDQIFK